MFVGGDHIMNDIMSDDDGSSEPNLKVELSRAGKSVDIPTDTLNGGTLYRGLGFIPEINKIFIREIERALNRI
jgi:cobalamin biosynthesis Co2+ chelatase CbiK